VTTYTTSNSIERIAGGASLIAAPLLALVSALITPQYDGMASELASMAAQPGQWLVSNILLLIASALFTPAIVAALSRLRGKLRLLGAVGGALIVLGCYFHGAVVGYSMVELPLVAQSGDPAQALAFAEAMYEHPAFTAILLPFLAFFLGLMLLAVALWAGRAAPPLAAIAIFAAPLSELFGPEWSSPELMWLLLLAGFGWLGLQALRRPAPTPAPAAVAALAPEA
jgi:hypothetical protein